MDEILLGELGRGFRLVFGNVHRVRVKSQIQGLGPPFLGICGVWSALRELRHFESQRAEVLFGDVTEVMSEVLTRVESFRRLSQG